MANIYYAKLRSVRLESVLFSWFVWVSIYKMDITGYFWLIF